MQATSREAALARYLNRVWVCACVFLAIVFAATLLAFVWPNRPAVRTIDAGKVDDLRAYFAQEGEPFYHREGRFYVVPSSVSRSGVRIVEPRSGHPKEIVWWCPTSGLFEGSLGSKFAPSGGVLPGSPSPTGLSMRPVRVTPGGDVIVDMTERLIGEDSGVWIVATPTGRPSVHPPVAHCYFPPADYGR